MKKVVFYEAAAPVAYSSLSRSQQGNKIGGAEATLAEIAEQLTSYCTVVVAQKHRAARERIEGSKVEWVPLAEVSAELATADAVVMQRRIGDTIAVRRHARKVPLFVWYHDWYFPPHFAGSRYQQATKALKVDLHLALHRWGNVTGICVSRAHVANVRAHLRETRIFPTAAADAVHLDYIYNPVASNCINSRGFDPDKLIFFSAPWKGLDQVLDRFVALRRELPSMKLYVAYPGYASDGMPAQQQNVRYLGNLSQREVLEEVSSSLCVFYPAHRMPETFGLVFAESHEVGTPVLAHPHGAAPELLSEEELVDADDIGAIVERVRAWRAGKRPQVVGLQEYAIDNVVDRWRHLLFG